MYLYYLFAEMLCLFSDDLCTKVELGQQYDIIGTERYVTEGDNTIKMFEVNNIVRVGIAIRSNIFVGMT
jgi:hypothetical protein